MELVLEATQVWNKGQSLADIKTEHDSLLTQLPIVCIYLAELNKFNAKLLKKYMKRYGLTEEMQIEYACGLEKKYNKRMTKSDVNSYREVLKHQIKKNPDNFEEIAKICELSIETLEAARSAEVKKRLLYAVKAAAR